MAETADTPKLINPIHVEPGSLCDFGRVVALRCWSCCHLWLVDRPAPLSVPPGILCDTCARRDGGMNWREMFRG